MTSNSNQPFTQGFQFQLPEGTKTKQDLKIVRHKYIGMKDHGDLPADSPAAFMLRGFDSIFSKHGMICEGLLTDLIWGLRQSKDFKDEMIGAALTQLRLKKYIYYSDPDGNTLSDVALMESKNPIWIRYNKRFLDCFSAV